MMFDGPFIKARKNGKTISAQQDWRLWRVIILEPVIGSHGWVLEITLHQRVQYLNGSAKYPIVELTSTNTKEHWPEQNIEAHAVTDH